MPDPDIRHERFFEDDPANAFVFSPPDEEEEGEEEEEVAEGVDQPRVPKGTSTGGQWTDGGNSSVSSLHSSMLQTHRELVITRRNLLEKNRLDEEDPVKHSALVKERERLEREVENLESRYSSFNAKIGTIFGNVSKSVSAKFPVNQQESSLDNDVSYTVIGDRRITAHRVGDHVELDFTQKDQFLRNVSGAIQPHTLTTARFLKDFVRELADSGFTVRVAPADTARRKAYAKVLRSMGLIEKDHDYWALPPALKEDLAVTEFPDNLVEGSPDQPRVPKGRPEGGQWLPSTNTPAAFEYTRFRPEFDAAFDSINQTGTDISVAGRNYVAIYDLRQALPHYSTMDFDKGVRQLRVNDLYSAETLHKKSDPRVLAGGFQEGSEFFVYLSKLQPGRR